jgi:pSer/pThr/pTyr-binding forkhead associated (FHA) protein
MPDPQGMPAAPPKGTPRSRLALRFISGKYQGGEFPIEENRPIVVGRSSDLDMVLVEEMVSRKHARIELKEGKIHIEDLGSTNGTFVNGERIVKGWLKEGDRVLIGSNILKVISTTEEPGQPNTRRAPPGAAPVAKPSTPRKTEAGGESRMRGSLEEIPLPDLLQLFGTSRKSGVLVVETDQNVGRIFLDQGLIHHVTVEQSGGKEVSIAPLKAFYRMLTWDRGSFELEPPSTKKFESPLNASVQEVLMEGFRQRDEFEHLKGRLPKLEDTLEVVTPVVKPLRDLSPQELDVFQVILSGTTFVALLDASALTDLEVATGVSTLLEKGYAKKR